MTDQFTITLSGVQLHSVIQSIEKDAAEVARLNAGSKSVYASLAKHVEEKEAIAAELRDVLGWPKGGERATEAA